MNMPFPKGAAALIRCVLGSLLLPSASTLAQTTLPNSVHVAMSATEGMEVDYTPAAGVAQNFYPGNTPCSNQPSSWPFLTIIDLDRATLAFNGRTCYGANDNVTLQSYLSTLSNSHLLLASTGSALGALNLAPIGGTDFTQPNARAAYNYSIIGYGKTSAGLATESYNTSPGQPWHGIVGNLVQFAYKSGNTSATYFGFQPSDPVGFSVVAQPNALPSIVIGNVDAPNFPINVSSLANFATPAGFSNQSYSPPSVNGTGGAIWLLALDRRSLGVAVNATISSTNSDNSPNNSQISTLAQWLAELSADNSYLLFITTLPGTTPPLNFSPTTVSGTLGTASGSSVGVNASSDWQTYGQLLSYIQSMGVSPHAFDKAVRPPTVVMPEMGLPQHLAAMGSQNQFFSMVGIPNGFTAYASMNANAPCAQIPNNATTQCGPNTNQWFSSTIDAQQGETGSLKGSLTRDKAYQYAPSGVVPFDISQMADQSAASQLEGNLSMAIASAPPVTWPLMDTPAHQAAYQQLSGVLLAKAFTNGCTGHCDDIRFYYPGDQLQNLASLPGFLNSVQYVTSSTFDQQSWEDVKTQLATELGDLSNVIAYQTWLTNQLSTNNETIALNLTKAAMDVATELNTSLGQPKAANTPVHITEEVFSYGAEILGGSTDPASAPMNALSGIMKAVATVLQLAQGTQVDPYVTQLGQLLDTSTGNATAAAESVMTDVNNNKDAFFNGVYNDWFKLQMVSKLSVSVLPGGWYVQDANADMGYMDGFLSSARRSFYVQTAQQYFGTKYSDDGTYNGQGYSNFDNWNIMNAFGGVDNSGGNLSSATDYSFFVRNSLPWEGASGTLTYNFVTTASGKFWQNAFGMTLMGPQSASDGTGNLNLNRDMLYDSIFPQISSYDFNAWMKVWGNN